MTGAGVQYSTSEPAVAKNDSSQRSAIFIAYLAFGPPIGAVLLMSGAGATMIYTSVTQGLFDTTGQEMLSAMYGFFGLTVLAITVSYFIGGIQAALAGLIVCLFTDREGRFSYKVALLAALPPSLIGAAIFAEGSPATAAILVALGVLASLVIRFVLRESFGPVKNQSPEA